MYLMNVLRRKAIEDWFYFLPMRYFLKASFMTMLRDSEKMYMFSIRWHTCRYGIISIQHDVHLSKTSNAALRLRRRLQ